MKVPRGQVCGAASMRHRKKQSESLLGLARLLTDELQTAAGATELASTLTPRSAGLAFGVTDVRTGSAVAVESEASVVTVVVSARATLANDVSYAVVHSPVTVA